MYHVKCNFDINIDRMSWNTFLFKLHFKKKTKMVASVGLRSGLAHNVKGEGGRGGDQRRGK